MGEPETMMDAARKLREILPKGDWKPRSDEIDRLTSILNTPADAPEQIARLERECDRLRHRASSEIANYGWWEEFHHDGKKVSVYASGDNALLWLCERMQRIERERDDLKKEKSDG